MNSVDVEKRTREEKPGSGSFANVAGFFQLKTAVLMVMACPSLTVGQQWYVEMYPGNRDYLEVTVDTRNVPKHSHLEEVQFEVTLSDSHGKLLKKESFHFTDDSVRTLASNLVHRRYFRHGIAPARQAKGLSLRYTEVSPVYAYGGNPPPDKRKGTQKCGGKIQEGTADIRVRGPIPKPANSP